MKKKYYKLWIATISLVQEDILTISPALNDGDWGIGEMPFDNEKFMGS